jgi:hypothetical protein
MLVRVTIPGTGTELWQWWHTVERLKKDLKTIEVLTSQGFQQVPTADGESYFGYLAGQCCEVVYIDQPSDNTVELWARSEDIEYVKQHPVILAFQLPEGITIPNTKPIEGVPPGMSMIPMLQFLPPPNLGEYAIITEGNNSTIYHISQLPEASHSLRLQLGDALRRLSAPGTWIEFEPNIMQLAADPRRYNQAVSHQRSEILRRRGQAREGAKQVLAQIEAAYEQANNIRIAEMKTDWDVQWKAIRRMARELAEAYYSLHHSKIQKAKPLPEVTNVFHEGISEIITSLPFQVYHYATIAAKTTWHQEVTGQEHEVIIAYHRSKKSGTTIVQVRGDATGQNREMVLAGLSEQVQKLSDLDSDIFYAMVAQLLHGQKDAGGNTWITASQILDYRGIKPITKIENGHSRRAGHRREDIEGVSQCITSMENTWIRVYEQEIVDSDAEVNKARRRGRSKITRESRLFMFGDIIYHQELSMDGTPGRRYPIAWQYRESSWMLPFLAGPNRFTGMLLEKTLNYDPHNEFWEKRLAKYFMVYLRSNASHHTKPPITVQTLFDECNLPINERFPQRTHDRFEKAMNTLQKDGHFVWDYMEKDRLPARNWLTTWLGYRIIVGSPEHITSQYLPIETHAQALRSQNRMQHKPGGKKQGRKSGGKKS